MKTTFTKELPLILMVLAPFIYLMIIWKSIPEQIPMQYDFHGDVSRIGSKNELLPMPFLLPGLMYLILVLVPLIDPKGRITKMGNKYYQLKFFLVLFMSALAFYMIYSSAAGNNASPNGALALLGLLFAVMGNYFQSIQPNYFIGIRTPWTLENETVWRETHRIGGIIWLCGGLLIVITSLALPGAIGMSVFIVCVAVMAVVPIIYSYLKYKQLKKENSGQ